MQENERPNAVAKRLQRGWMAVALCTIVLLAALWVGSVTYIEGVKAKFLADAEGEAVSLVNQFEARVSSVLKGADDYIRAARRAYEREGGIEGVRAFVADVPLHLRDTSHLTVMNAQGQPILITTGLKEREADPDVTGFDRPYFQELMNSTSDTPYVSVARKGRNTGVVTIRVARRLTDADGRFDGVIFAAVKVSALTESVLSPEARLGTTGTIVGLDDRVILRSSDSGIAGKEPTLSHMQFGHYEGHDAQTAVASILPSPQGRRIVAHRSVDIFPLFAVIDIPETAALGTFSAIRTGGYALTGLLSFLIAAVAVLIGRRIADADAAQKIREFERQQAEAARLFNRVQSLMSDSPVGISIVSLQGNKRLYVNQTLVDLFGARDADELMEVPISETYAHAEDYLAVRKMSRETLSVPTEVERRRIDGSTWWCLVHRQYFDYQGEDCLLIWYHDVTEKYRAEESIRAAERDYKDVFENATQGIVVTEPDGGFIRVNSAFARMLGFDSPDDLVENISDIGSQIWTNRTERREMIQLLNSEKRVFKETLFNRRDGSRIWVAMAVWGRWDDEGRLERIEGIIEDISSRKETEFALITAMDIAESANRAKSEFLSSMSHELRTPLNSILGFAQVLQMTARGSLNERQNQGVNQIINSGKHLLALIEDVLDLAKIESGRASLNLETVHVDALVRDCTTLVQDMAGVRNIRISKDIVTETTEISVDQTRLKQVLINLLSNAIKYNHENGSVSVTVSDVSDDKLRIAVKDSGFGIPSNVGDDIFAPFNRIGAENLEVEGSGIGLTISKNLMDMMGGDIGYESIEGVGSTFWITIPRALRDFEESGGNEPRVA